jgi:hypothetical protein
VTVSWFGPQNQICFGLSVAPQNRQRDVDVRHTSRFSVLLHVEVSWDSVSQSGLKTSGDTMASDTRDTITEVNRSQVEDGRVDATGCVGFCYPTFTVFNVLGLMCIVVI